MMLVIHRGRLAVKKNHRPDRRPCMPRATASFYSKESSGQHPNVRPDWLIFQHAAEAMDEGRFTEAATICEEALQPHLGTARMTLPPSWSLLQLQLNLVESLFHAKQYQRVIHTARWLRRLLPQRLWAKPLWLEGLAYARLGQQAEALQTCILAFTSGSVPEELRGPMRASFAVACMEGGAGYDSVPCPPDCRNVHAADAAYPFLTANDHQEHMFAPIDALTDCACSLHPEWHQRRPSNSASCDSTAKGAEGAHASGSSGLEALYGSWDDDEGRHEGAWSREMLVRFMLFGDPYALPVTKE